MAEKEVVARLGEEVGGFMERGWLACVERVVFGRGRRRAGSWICAASMRDASAGGSSGRLPSGLTVDILLRGDWMEIERVRIWESDV